ncbi:MAG: right-handed parallel beta-helix repeat-containing protein [Dehalococcoidia bacterium]|nr:right-handed parallel beta-helix repeat-containing protein [Dehalococcoidia bacterium]
MSRSTPAARRGHRWLLAVGLATILRAVLGGLGSSGVTPARAAGTLWVRADGSDGACNGSANASAASAPNCAKRSIQAAIDAASAGDTVNVGPGAYSETAAGRTLTSIGGVYQFGLFFPDAKPNLTVRGVTAGGVPIATAAAAVATITTNATNNFGPSGVFVEGDGVTIAGVIVGTNTGGQNKTVEVIGDAFTLKDSQVNDPGGSLYVNDFRFDNIGDVSHVQSYAVTGNQFADGVSVDLASGAGYSGLVANRVITGNTFAANTMGSWPMISFNGSGSCVAWFTYGVGGAVITGNTFGHASQYIRARADYDNSQFNWASYFTGNTFTAGAVVAGSTPPATLTEYSYPTGCGTFLHVRHIGGVVQEEVDHASSGDTVLATAGSWAEQVVVTKDLHLVGAGSSLSTISAPASIPAAADPDSAVVKIAGAVNVEVTGWRVAGPGPSGCGSIGFGILVRDGATADIHHNRVTAIRDNPFSGCQNGVAVQVGRALWATSGSADIHDNTIDDYQKNGVTVSGAGSSATVTNNVVTGAGPTATIAQNGIQISSGATATITGNQVSGNSYTVSPVYWVSTGLLLYGAGATNTSGNTISQNQVGLYRLDTAGWDDANTISATSAGTGAPSFWGEIVDAPPPGHAPSSPEEIVKPVLPKIGPAVVPVTAVSITNSTFAGDGTAAAVAGVEADGGYGSTDIDLTATNNFVNGWATGVELYLCTSSCSGTGFANLQVESNHLAGNTIGLDNSSAIAVDAELNWWGSGTGPTNGANPGGTGAAVTGPSVDFAPWLCTGTDTSGAAGFQPYLGAYGVSPCDTSPPTVTMKGNVLPVINPYFADTWTTYTVQVAFTCVDSGSGIDPLAPNTITQTLQYSNSGVYVASVTGSCQDRAGNVLSGTFTFGKVKIDKQKPVCTVLTSLAAGGPFVSNLTIANNNTLRTIYVQVSVSDPPFGPPFAPDPGQPVIKLVSVTGNDGAVAADMSGWTTGTADFVGQLRGKKARGPRTYTLTYSATDAAGNVGTCLGMVKVP